MAAPTGKVLLPTFGPSLRCNIHPLVLFSICDAYIRRSEKQERVIGTLLGSIADGVVEVKNCYVVPHNESSDQVAVDIAHHKAMFDLHQKVAANEAVVGWFATGNALYGSDALIQEFYLKECHHPVHLVVDTTLSDKGFSIQAYVSRSLGLADKPLALQFVEVPCDVQFSDAEKVGVDLLSGGTSGTSAKALSDADNLHTSLKRLQEMLDRAGAYVEEVVAGKKPADPTIGRYLADTLGVVPHFSKIDFEKLFNDSVHDVLLVAYLSNLIRSHIALAEKLGTSALPIL